MGAYIEKFRAFFFPGGGYGRHCVDLHGPLRQYPAEQQLPEYFYRPQTVADPVLHHSLFYPSHRVGRRGTQQRLAYRAVQACLLPFSLVYVIYAFPGGMRQLTL